MTRQSGAIPSSVPLSMVQAADLAAEFVVLLLQGFVLRQDILVRKNAGNVVPDGVAEGGHRFFDRRVDAVEKPGPRAPDGIGQDQDQERGDEDRRQSAY